uniref:Uncharacterized protein n=1 Tax=Arundo donax TaxID=35708 RepID=A0A0A9H495_ARUDO
MVLLILKRVQKDWEKRVKRVIS